MPLETNDADWFATWFDSPYYHVLYANHTLDEAEGFAEKLAAHLALQPGTRVVDVACGRGRHIVPFAHMGMDAYGFDLSPQSIAAAKEANGDIATWRVHDMRQPLPDVPFNLVLNLFTSFGYFADDDTNLSVMKNFANALSPDGYLVVDFLNAPKVRTELVPHASIERAGVSFDIQKMIVGRHVVKDIRFSADGQTHKFQEKVQLFTKDELEAIAGQCGLRPVAVWGNYALGQYDAESPRCILLFQKPL